jgi:hypothetical protein
MGSLAKERQPSAGRPERSVEDLLSEIAADQVVLRVTLQSFLVRLFASRPDDATLGLVHLRDQVLRSIARVPLDAPNGADDGWWKRQLASRAEQLFDEIGAAFGTDTSGPPDVSH